MKSEEELRGQMETIKKGGAEKYHIKAKERGKLFVRGRLKLLLDDESFAEDGMFANVLDGKLPADGVVCGVGKVHGRSVAIMANDSTIKAGSWGWRTVEKIVRIQETAVKLKVPLIYLVDSAGARITDQVEMFPGRRGAGRIFYNEANISGVIPQICGLFGPSAAGGAYIPAFCDVTYMVDGNASMYLGSPRMAEMVIGEKVTLEEMGGAKMHCTTSGSGDMLCKTEEEVIDAIKKHLTYFPQNCDEKPKDIEPKEPEFSCDDLENIIPKNENVPFDMYDLIKRIVDRDSFLEIKKIYAPEIIVGFSRIGGKSIGVIANQPKAKGGVLFVESAYKAGKFIQLCDAFNIPLLYLADVPGFMIGTAVEKQGIIRAGARMIFSVSQATVPKVSIIVRKAYGAGLYAMAGPGYEPDCCLALPTAMIAVMGPEAAVNAVFFNKIMELPEEERPAYINKLREDYRKDVDIYKLGAELVTDGMVAPSELRNEIINRFKKYESKDYHLPKRRHGVIP
ncbi:MAG: acyl-CoA carboxylase subunit beta [Thermoplasmata archaeon]|nr:MAG: acyl-CoA carboxylase subunit beta [Thermoplasmata archaeon]